MPRTKGSVNKKGKQTLDERKEKRRASKKPNSLESRQKEYAKRKVDRREKQIEKLNQRIKQQRNELYSVGRFAGSTDPALKELGKLLDSPVENKLEYVATNSKILWIQRLICLI